MYITFHSENFELHPGDGGNGTGKGTFIRTVARRVDVILQLATMIGDKK